VGAEREACREVPRTLHPLHPLSIARNFPTRRAVGGVGAVLPAFVFSGLYGPARQLPPATLSARHVEDDRRCEDHEQRELHPLIEVALHKAQGMRTSRDSPPQKSEGDWVPRALPSPLQSIARPLPVSDNGGGADGSEDECSWFVFHVNPVLSAVVRVGQSEPIGQFTIWSVVTFLMRKSSGRAPRVSDS